MQLANGTVLDVGGEETKTHSRGAIFADLWGALEVDTVTIDASRTGCSVARLAGAEANCHAPSSVSGGNSGATLEMLRAISSISSPRPAAVMSRAMAWAVNIAERSR